jgi:hypothetical protein
LIVNKYPVKRGSLIGPTTALASALLFCPATTLADISYARTVTVTAAGAVAGYSSETKVLTQIAGDRARTETIPSDGMLADFTPTQVSIIRLDKDTTFQLDPDSQTYRETTLPALRQQMSDLRAQVNEASGGQALPVATDTCQWSEAKFKSKKTKEKERIAGIRATRHLLTMSQSCEEPNTGRSCDLEWTMEPWLAKRVPDRDEVSEFYQSLADRLSMDYLIPQMPGASQFLLGMFPNRWESLLDEMEEFEGYPIRNVMTLKIGGKLCTTAEGVPVVEDGMWGNAATSAYNKAIDRTGSETGRAVGTATGEAMGDSIGGSIGGAAVGAATGEIIGGIAGMFKKEKPRKTSTQRVAAPQDVTVFRIQSEVTEWGRVTVPPERFEVPAGWQRVQ